MGGDLICPECAQGKCDNCTLEVLDDGPGEHWLPCACVDPSHAPDRVDSW